MSYKIGIWPNDFWSIYRNPNRPFSVENLFGRPTSDSFVLWEPFDSKTQQFLKIGKKIAMLWGNRVAQLLQQSVCIWNVGSYVCLQGQARWVKVLKKWWNISMFWGNRVVKIPQHSFFKWNPHSSFASNVCLQGPVCWAKVPKSW